MFSHQLNFVVGVVVVVVVVFFHSERRGRGDIRTFPLHQIL